MKKPAEKKVSKFQWFNDLYNITDETVLQECGEEVLFYLKYEKYVAILFLIMAICNIPVLSIYFTAANDQKENKISFLASLTVSSIFDMEKGSNGGDNKQDQSYLWGTLILFIFHVMFQHLEIIIYL